MKKLCGLFFAAILSLAVICGCSSQNNGDSTPKLSEEDIYINTLNNALVSFSDCADALSTSLQEISDTTKIPSETQLDKISAAVTDLSDVCARIQAIEAPAKYTQAAAELSDAMQKYTSALQKCTELLNFYREFDSKIREYDDPVKGSKELTPKATEIYNEFASQLQQATAAFNSACQSIEQVRTA